MNVYGYARVSTMKQVKDGESLEVQEDAMRRLFECDYAPRGYQLAGILRDPAESGSKPLLNRPGGAQLSLLLERGDVVLFPKLDRGFRSTLDMLKTVHVWKQRGISIRMMDIGVDTSTPIGEMILTIMAAVAQFERDRIRDRIQATFLLRRKQRAEGKDVITSSRPPYGLKVEKKGGKIRWVRDDYMREVGASIVKWREELHMSWRQVMVHMWKNRIYRLEKGRWLPWNRYASIQKIYKSEKLLQAKENEGGSSLKEAT